MPKRAATLAGRKCREAGKQVTGRIACRAHRRFSNVLEALDGICAEKAEAISETVFGIFECRRSEHF
jgi:hypothetical protein